MPLFDQMSPSQKASLWVTAGALIIAVAAYTWVSRDQDQPIIVDEPPVSRQESTIQEPPTPPQARQKIVVDVLGEVQRPGLYEIPVGSRVIHAIEVAGGLTENADRERVNMAKKLKDGDQIKVPGLEVDSKIEGGAMQISLNRAGQEELMKLPGIGAALAQRIIAYRQSQGGFRAIEEIKNVSGISEGVFNDIKDMLIL